MIETSEKFKVWKVRKGKVMQGQGRTLFLKVTTDLVKFYAMQKGPIKMQLPITEREVESQMQ